MTNNTTPPTPLDHLFHWERLRPDAIWLTQPLADGRVRRYSWRQVADQVRRMAQWLENLRLPPCSQIALLGKNSAHWIMADLAIWLAGHVSVPLYPTLSAATARHILLHSEARLVLVGRMDELWEALAPSLQDLLPMATLPLAPALAVPHWDAIIAATPPLARHAQRRPEELATIIYTSGSTGEPKGVMISFAALSATAQGLGGVFPLSVRERMLSYLPLAHAAERAMVETMALHHGFRIYFAWSLETFMQDLRRARPTLFFSVPRLWTKFRQGIEAKLPAERQERLQRVPVLGWWLKRRILRQLGLDHVRVAITGSAPLAPATVAWYRGLGLELLEGYGMSENFAYSHGNRPGDVGPGTVGAPMPGVEQRISASGEIEVRSPATMLGYFRDAAQTETALSPDGFLRTGDRGHIDARGRLTITGRTKELFKTAKGKYVAPVPIENRLAAHAGVEAVCVTGSGWPQPFALLLAAAGAGKAELERELRQLLHSVNAALEDHERLSCLVVVQGPWTVANGLLTPTLKIRRERIEAHYLERLGNRPGSADLIWE